MRTSTDVRDGVCAGSGVGVRIVEPGLLTTVQDLGRVGHQHEGMVVAGAMDAFSMQVANLLVGNERNAACLEVTLLGPKLEFVMDVLFAVTGAQFGLKLDGAALPGWRAVQAKAGSVLEFGAAGNGCRGYLAIAGGIAVPSVMGSRATYLRGQVSGFHGRALERGDVLQVYAAGVANTCRSWYIRQPHYPVECTVRVVCGPHAEMFTKEGLATFFSSEYDVTPASDRMGYRLKGATIERNGSSDIISDSIPLGGIQVPADGQPIVLMADRQTTGGYPRIGTVISVDLPWLAQCKPGSRVRFQKVAVEEAQRLYREMEHLLVNFAREYK